MALVEKLSTEILTTFFNKMFSCQVCGVRSMTC